MTNKMTTIRNAQANEMKKTGAFKKTVLSLVLATSALVTPLMTAAAEDCGCIKYSGVHIVKKGDTMYQIAKAHNLTVNQLMDANFTVSSSLAIGQKVMIPDANQPYHGTVTTAAKATQYKVLKGDTLYSISKKTGVSVAQLKKINNLKTNTIRVGQVLKLTAVESGVKSLTTASYVVKSGDTKTSLKQKFGTTIALPTTLKVGQKLTIKGKVLQIVADKDFKLADGRVIEVVSGGKAYVVNVYEGNHSISHWAYRTDKKFTFTVVQVGQRNEVISLTVK